MLHIRSPEFIHYKSGNVHLYTHHLPIALTPRPQQPPIYFVFLWVQLFYVLQVRT